jgi:subtilisin family serine protease
LHSGKVLHDAGFEGQGMKIAVFDAGFDRVDKIESFKHLFNSGRIFPVRNIVENTPNLYTLDGHGTAVLGCMASFVNDSIVASAPKASYYLFITEDPRSETRVEELNWAVAAEMADSIGIDIINSSLGYHQFDDPSQNYSRDDMDGKTTIISKAAAIAVEKGIIVVNSAGNHGNKEWNIVTAPADAEGVISVGALDINSSLADFSSRGYYKSNSIKPNIVGVGKGTTLYYDLGTYHYGSGTSFSTPLLAGLIACFWQKNRSLNPFELRSIIYSLSTNYSTPNLEIGFGIPKFDKELNLNSIKMKERTLSVYPNPSQGNTILEISSWESIENVEIQVFFGNKAVLSNKINVVKGVNHIFINTDNYAKGLYFIKVKLGNYHLEERYIKN